MKKILVLGLAASLAAGAVIAQTIDRQAALDSMVAAEHAFAKTAGEKGYRDAFLDFLADDSVIFRPDPVSGKEWFRARPVSPALLSWYPILAEVSLAGDLGYTTGPWEYRAKGADDPEVAATGNFVTLWRKQADGTWKALIDHGAENPKPASSLTASIAAAEPAKIDYKSLPKVDVEAERKGLAEADRAFGKAAEKASSAAYWSVLSRKARLYREGLQPAQGGEEIRVALAQDPAAMTWEPAGAVMAASGDLGATYGIAKSQEKGKEGQWVSSHNYFRIWKKQPDGWKLVVDVLTPRPQPVEKPVEKKPANGG